MRSRPVQLRYHIGNCVADEIVGSLQIGFRPIGTAATKGSSSPIFPEQPDNREKTDGSSRRLSFRLDQPRARPAASAATLLCPTRRSLARRPMRLGTVLFCTSSMTGSLMMRPSSRLKNSLNSGARPQDFSMRASLKASSTAVLASERRFIPTNRTNWRWPCLIQNIDPGWVTEYLSFPSAIAKTQNSRTLGKFLPGSGRVPRDRSGLIQVNAVQLARERSWFAAEEDDYDDI